MMVMASRNPHSHMIRKHIREHSLAYQLLLIVGGTVVIGGGFILLVKKMQGSRETAYESVTFSEEEIAAVRPEPTAQVFPRPLGNETLSLRQIIRSALEAHGGRDALEKVLTIRRAGTVLLFTDGEPQPPMEATIIYREPDMLRYTYVRDERTFLTSFDGEDAWWQAFSPEGISPPKSLDPEDFILLRQDLVTVRPISDTLTDMDRLSLLEEDPANAPQDHYRIRYALGWLDEILFLNKTHFLCERRESVLQVGNGKAQKIVLEYEDFRYVGDLVFPFSVRVIVDDELRNELILDEVETNAGVLPQIFRRPKG
jgi:hypothetical protein